MYLFIAIIFIAELIIVFHIISAIVRADKYVCRLNERVKECHPQIEQCIFSIKDCVSCAKSCVEAAVNFIKCKRQEFVNRIIKTLFYNRRKETEVEIKENKPFNTVTMCGHNYFYINHPHTMSKMRCGKAIFQFYAS